MKYDFESIIDRKNDPYSFSTKWKNAEYILDSLNIKNIREDSINMEMADMDYKVAPKIIEDLHHVVDHGIYGYSSLTKEYKEAVKNWYHRRQNWDFNINDIYYFPGTHEAISQCIRRYTKVNDGIIVLTPCYGYHSDVEGNNRRYIKVEMINNNEHFSIDYKALEKACKDPNNTMLIMCHPHNPTGRIFSEEEIKNVGKIARENNVLILSDEVHSDIIREDQKFSPIMKVLGSEGIISATAVNKTFNLAGLSMTNIIVCDPKLKPMLQDYWFLPSPFGIQAVISAYNKCEDWVNELNKYTDYLIDNCLDYIHKNFSKVKVIRPEGGYSLNLDFSDYGFSDDEVINKIYNKAGVILNSGLFFDDQRGKQVHRICLASPLSVCLEALKRIKEEFE